eukprot:4265311-Amphidinium_carterae.1
MEMEPTANFLALSIVDTSSVSEAGSSRLSSSVSEDFRLHYRRSSVDTLGRQSAQSANIT